MATVLSVVGAEPIKPASELAESERRRVLAWHPDRGDPEPTEAEEVLLEDLLIAIRRLDEVKPPCVPAATLMALRLIDTTVSRHLELKI